MLKLTINLDYAHPAELNTSYWWQAHLLPVITGDRCLSWHCYATLDTRDTMVSQEVEVMTTSETILAIRKSTGLSQAAFAKRFGIPKRTIEDWERGIMACPTYVAEMLAALAQTDYHTPRLTEEEH